MKSGEALGHAKGLAEGERKKALETAKAFKKLGLPRSVMFSLSF